MANHLAEDGLGCVPALLHRNLRNPREGLAILIERCCVPNYKDVRMIGNGKVRLNANAARPVDCTSKPFSSW